jgi:hypothetical protein
VGDVDGAEGTAGAVLLHDDSEPAVQRREDRQRIQGELRSSDRDHLISLWTVDLLQWGQNFFSSSRSVVFRRFFSVV